MLKSHSIRKTQVIMETMDLVALVIELEATMSRMIDSKP